ncbi:N-acetylneuraminate cytidylyltransferase [Lachnospiraceae bacterium KM106-2]|nr:N-acetylneuraminate cytidylyltransferase [Lachnospiraceae bacterium KM106-2]
MYKGKKIVAIIPARGGSKGIPNKNIIDLCGKPLIAHSIDLAKECSYIDSIVVSTDSEKIAEVAKECEASVPFLRPAELANDSAKTIDCLIYTIEELKKQGEDYDYLLLLQPTQPYRLLKHLTESIEQIIDQDLPSLVSVSPVAEHPILMRSINNDGTLQNLLSTSSTVRRQDFPDYYKVNGSIYLNRLDETFTNETSLNDNQYPYLMSNEFDIDIDTLQDLEYARYRLSK